MAESWYPNPGVTQVQHERLMGKAMPSGVFGEPGAAPLVYADGVGTREVRVRAFSQGFVEGYGYISDAAVTTLPALAANTSGSPRIDLVVLRLDRSDWSVRVKVVQGTPGAGAPSPINDSSFYDLPLAEVTVANNATTLPASAVKWVAWYLTEDGSILCTSGTRPPHLKGRTIFESDTGRFRVSDGTEWMTAVEDSGLVSVSLQSGYSAPDNRLQRVNGLCVLNLKVQRTNGPIPANATTRVGTLPAGFSPTFTVEGVARYSSSAGLSVGLQVTTSGGIYVVTPPTVDVDQNRTVNGSLTWIAA